MLQKRTGTWPIWGCAGADGRPSEVLPMKNRFTVSRQEKHVYYGAVFETKKEIPAHMIWVPHSTRSGRDG